MPKTLDELAKEHIGSLTLTVLELQQQMAPTVARAALSGELLAALKALVSHAEDDTDDRRLSEEVTAAKAAIKKAEAT